MTPPLLEEGLSADALYNRGVNKLQAGDYSGAIADFSCAINLNPFFSDAFYQRALAHEGLGNYY